MSRAAAFLIALNLALFILITSLPVFENRHHHWIFPILAVLYAIQWCAVRTPQARNVMLFIMLLLALISVARYETLSLCFDRCLPKLGMSILLMSLMFLWQAKLNESIFWSRRRSLGAVVVGFVWSGYLFMQG